MGSYSATRYVDDVPYTCSFTRELAPAWLDFVATLSGFEAPSRDGAFAWCELGCGQGITAAILAATHPAGTFHAIDAFAPHIARAQQLRDRAEIANLTLHAVDFASAADLDLPRFDYIVAHGVYSWVDARARDDMRRFMDRWLAPGGLVFVSYNAMPGWASDTPFQYLVRELAATCEGDSVDRFTAAMKAIDGLIAAGAPALTTSVMASGGVERLRRNLPSSYFAHEFLPTTWQPLYVTQVRADMASIGLIPAGCGRIRDNFDSFVLRPSARAALASFAEGDVRELARDFFLYERLRRDLFVRKTDTRTIGDEERSQRLWEMTFDLQRPAQAVEYEMVTKAGRVAFDRPSARAIVAALESRPKRLGDIRSDSVLRTELLPNALALCAAGEIRPVESTAVEVTQLNESLIEHITGEDELRFLALPCGTAVTVPAGLPRAMRAGAPVPDEVRPWVDFLGRYRAPTG